MCNIQKLKQLSASLEALASQKELITSGATEYNNPEANFNMAFNMGQLVVNQALENILDVDALIQALKAGKCRIEFIKANGEKREAIATLSTKLVDLPGKKSEAPKNAEILKFYDLEKNAFRSCRIASITSFKKVV